MTLFHVAIVPIAVLFYVKFLISYSHSRSSISLQAMMAKMFQEEFGDMLVMENLCDERGVNQLPSPNDLKRKILLKGKIKHKKKVR